MLEIPRAAGLACVPLIGGDLIFGPVFFMDSLGFHNRFGPTNFPEVPRAVAIVCEQHAIRSNRAGSSAQVVAASLRSTMHSFYPIRDSFFPPVRTVRQVRKVLAGPRQHNTST